MCDFEEFIFTCGHSTFRLQSYCHFARNDPNHECCSVKKLRNVWDQTYPCDDCRDRKGRRDVRELKRSRGPKDFQGDS